MFGEIRHQFDRHGGAEQTVRLFAVVARARDHADFVLGLHHQHRVRVSVDGAQMFHQRGQRAGVGVARELAVS
jgi:hypothetical protein